jgi:hypothetical protein
MTKTTSKVHELAAKGDGMLVRRGNVWSYPGASIDASGTNLHLPVEYVTDEEVQAALGTGDMFAVTRTADNQVLSVRIKDGDEDAPAVLTTAQAGTADAGTELPANSRPSHDAGKSTITSAEASEQAARAISAVVPQRLVRPAVVEGTSLKGRESPEHGEKEPTTERGARKGR